jgi:hypothetical protein
MWNYDLPESPFLRLPSKAPQGIVAAALLMDSQSWEQFNRNQGKLKGSDLRSEDASASSQPIETGWRSPEFASLAKVHRLFEVMIVLSRKTLHFYAN